MRWVLVAIIAGGTTAGDLLQAKGMRHHGEIHDFRPGAIGRVLAVVVRDRRILGAVCGYGVSFFAFLRLLSIAPVSFAVPATAASYVLETFLAKYLLRERITWRRWAGAVLVACGVVLLGL